MHSGLEGVTKMIKINNSFIYSIFIAITLCCGYVFAKNTEAPTSNSNKELTAVVAVPEGEGGKETLIPSVNDSINISMNGVNSVTSETTQLLGESIDLNYGGLSFSNTDVSIPGNGRIPMSIGRVFHHAQYRYMSKVDFSDWHLDIPHIKTTIVSGRRIPGPWGTRRRECTGEPEIDPASAGYDGGWFSASEYFNGITVHIPGIMTERLLYSARDIRLGKSNWKVRCAANSTSNHGEMFVITSTDGTEYTFSQRALRDRGVLENNTGRIARYAAYMYITKIKDRFGHQVNYYYTSQARSSLKVLSRISASDGREITIQRDLAFPYQNLITSIQANGKTWQYKYSSNGSRKLTRVIRPDNREWLIELADFKNERATRNECGSANSSPAIGTITHPNGVKGTFTLDIVVHGRSNVTKTYDPRNRIHYTHNCTQQMSIKTKVLEGAGLIPMKWEYSYSQNNGYYLGESNVGRGININLPSGFDPLQYKSTTVRSPNGAKINYIHNRNYQSALDGSLTIIEQFDVDGVSLLSRKINRYEQGPFLGDTYTEHVNTKPVIYRLNLIEEILQTFNNGNSTNYHTQYSDFNTYGIARKTYQYNSFNDNKRYIKQAYYHDTTNWLLNLPTTTHTSDDGQNYTLIAKQSYHGATSAYKSSPDYHYTFGRWVKRNESYHTSSTDNGHLRMTRLNATNRWKEVSNYYRGVPQTIRTPQSTSTNSQYAYRQVDNNGWITQTTDFNGNITDYSYDSLGRVVRISPRNSDWQDTTITYTNANHGEIAGITSGMLVKTTKRGYFEQKIYYDSLLRPVLTKERDITDSSTARYVKKQYNTYGKVIFVSQPSANENPTIGTYTTYDGLGRITKVYNNALGGNGVRYYYYPDSKVAVTDNRNLTTTTTYQAYGAPSLSRPTYIETPSNLANIAMQYNQFGNLTHITQSGITESRIYDAYQNLCKIVRPETGITAMSYNSQQQLLWSAQGTLGSSTTCDLNAVPENHRVILNYDNLGQLRTENYADSSPDKTYSYDNNGNLTQLQSGSNTWNYIYNSLNAIEKETLNIDGKSFSFDWEYNNLGAVKSLTYPSGLKVNYAPNALGQPTKANDYAKHVRYHPNGQIKSMRYGNGIRRNIALDTVGRIDLIDDIKSATIINQLDPSYDLNSNITQILDASDNHAYDVTNLTYDGLDRLKTANGHWGAGSYHYDALGNITSRTLNNSTLGYVYDNNNRLSHLTGSHAYRYQYNPQGNMTHNGRYSLTFNRANQLISAKGLSYVYDGYNRRVRQTKTDGNHYTVYSHKGALLYQLAANNDEKNNIYLGQYTVAEDDGTPPLPPPPSPPELTLRFTTPEESCGFQCVFSSYKYGEVKEETSHKLTWHTRHATQCSGTLQKVRVGRVRSTESITGTSSLFQQLSYPADGTVYNVTLTCQGPGGSITKTASATTSQGDEF